ncbi:Os04g0583000 [Oryza sativa Japonica Group]|uniref:Os04g0583000 protein n=1 Tax=Oryza sativa subsp. japonica TaxID=39947 RepID=C7J1S1_ORYSJ|nr:Os04g0583000 [Oryza sativa Japonica Group]|eukprot:NP_001174065.1 Os04g0583000 [Oryza sativa Japonica Group]
MASGWAQLPDDLLDNVAQRTAGIKDYVRLRAVCKSWRSFLRPRSRPPWLMLPYDPCSESCVRGFLDASDGTVHEIDLPGHERQAVLWLVARLARPRAVARRGVCSTGRGGGGSAPGPFCGGGRRWRRCGSWSAVRGSGGRGARWAAWAGLCSSGRCAWLRCGGSRWWSAAGGRWLSLGAEEEAVFCRPTDASWTPLACPAGAFAAVDVACQSGLFHLVSHHGRVAVFDLVSPLREVPTRRDRLHALAHTWDGRCLVQRRGGCGHEPLLLATWSGGGGAG